MKLTNLMSELVKRNGSDLHLTGDSFPFFRIQGQILPASSEQYSSKELRADLTQILGNEKLTKFDKEKDCLLYTSPSPRDKRQSRMPSSA